MAEENPNDPAKKQKPLTYAGKRFLTQLYSTDIIGPAA
jgi:hypothetical protein